MERDKEAVISVCLDVLIYVDPDGLPALDSDEFKSIAAEHIADKFRQTPEFIEDEITSAELIDVREL